ncbi:Protein of unknown function [Pyronema omphalodes CBS 100304]|uniref:Uncharacterized protein n=1 Tax=Pyronema omphalodes (strain CBS 100304) TaxID=1076935 RepID=U4LBJ7_PYROM|nr:Protein of unknown function [Pyronema omphalodes CBS 100304]
MRVSIWHACAAQHTYHTNWIVERIHNSSQLDTGSIHSDARPLVEPDPKPEPKPNAATTQTSSLQGLTLWKPGLSSKYFV